MSEKESPLYTYDGSTKSFNLYVPVTNGPTQTIPDDPWKHRTTGMRCCTCMWFVQKDPIGLDLDHQKGRCRRHAPTMSGYPVVFAIDWCGDHKLA